MNKKIKYFDLDGMSHVFTFENFPNICSCCGIGADLLSEHAVFDKNNRKYNFLVRCSVCGESSLIKKRDGVNGYYQYPLLSKQTKFSNEINKVSAEFETIYNQAEMAEAQGLNQICGAGYRKSLEFLIKDFLINLYPDNKHLIESEYIAASIKRIDNDKIQTLASRSAWLGNDETHYVKKHTDRDIEDLKKFLNATVKYIDMELTVVDALSVEKK